MTPAARRALRALSATLAALVLASCNKTNAPVPVSVEPPPGTYVQVGKNLLAANEPELAFDAFINAMRVDGVTAEALTGAGIASQKQGLLTTARRYFLRAIELDPASITAHNNLGVVQFSLKEYYPARDAFRAAYALSSGRSEIAESNLNRVEAIVAEIEQAGQEDPEISHRVVRLGTSVFQITPIGETPVEMIDAN